MSRPFFSVILPEHNSAAYMRKMLDSIRGQTFTDYELIIVCDRCADNTAEIASEYSEKVLEVDFGKCALTRNAGLDVATGEWVLFADDDDWFLHPYVFEILHAALKENDCDVLAFGFICDWKDGKGNVIAPFHHPRGSIWVAPWTKAWRRSFIGDHRFPDWKHSDDLGFAEEMYPLTDKWDFLNHALYYYNYIRTGSIQDKLRTGELSNDDMKE